jgi:tyrosyl-tRNA synthetase
MTLIEELKYRGFLHQCTDEESLNKKLKSENITFYIGFDCTAKSLHIGSLIQIMIMRLFQKYGHTPIILIGTGTTRIGDPSGKDETRKILTDDEIKNNANNLKTVFDKYLSFKNEENKALVMDNADWLDKLSYVDFLRDFGKHFTINKMLTFDSVKIRLEREQSLSFVEFNYMIFQAYDFYELNNRNSCTLQIGGSDQWGNIVNGVELIRRVNGKEVYGLTTPLLTNSNGDKMGKTADGAIWLNDDLLSAYDYWQFWRNVDDRDVIRFMKLFTDLSKEQIDSHEQNSSKNINDLKIILANEVTAMLHGIESSRKAEQAAKQIFENKSLSEDMPTLNLSNEDVQNGALLSDLIVQMKYANSKSESRKLIRGKGVKLNGKIVENELQLLDYDQITQFENVISVGKKKHFKVIIG